MKVAYPVFVDGTSLAAMYARTGEDFGDRGAWRTSTAARSWRS